MRTLEPDGPRTAQQPGETGERRLAGWQRALRWILLIAAIGVSSWCLAKPLGGPKVELTEPAHLRGTFVSRTSWGLVLLGALLTVGGVAGAGAAIYDVSTGRVTAGDVVHDVAIFVEGWIAELIAGISYDAELENTHAYALFLLLIPGLILLWLNLVPVLNRGSEFRVEANGSVLTRRRDSWDPLLEYGYSTVTADGTAISFPPPPDGPPAITFPQARVFCRENGARLSSGVSAAFFRELLARRGFEVSAGCDDGHFTARRS